MNERQRKLGLTAEGIGHLFITAGGITMGESIVHGDAPLPFAIGLVISLISGIPYDIANDMRRDLPEATRKEMSTTMRARALGGLIGGAALPFALGAIFH